LSFGPPLRQRAMIPRFDSIGLGIKVLVNRVEVALAGDAPDRPPIKAHPVLVAYVTELHLRRFPAAEGAGFKFLIHVRSPCNQFQ
jgi:hypothetical protein